MNPGLLSKLWHSSPDSLIRAVRRRYERRHSKPGWFTVRAGPLAGADLFLPSDKLDVWVEMLNGEFDHFLYEALLPRCKLEGATCWDIGAHFGYHSFSFAALGARVVSFEPNPYNRARFQMHLERNQKLAQRVKLLALAVSDQDGEMSFVQSSDMDGASSGSHLAEGLPPLGHSHYRGPLWEETKVATRRMDTLIDQGEPPPDVVKIDVEGAEAMVLKGGQKFLSKQRPWLLIEVHQIRLLLQIQKTLLEWNYTIELLDENHATPTRCFVLAAGR